MPVSKYATYYKGYAISPRMGRWDVYPPNKDKFCIADGFEAVYLAARWIDEHIAELAAAS